MTRQARARAVSGGGVDIPPWMRGWGRPAAGFLRPPRACHDGLKSMRRYAGMTRRPAFLSVFLPALAIVAVTVPGIAQRGGGGPQTGTIQVQPSQRPLVPVTDEMLWKPDPANWLMWRRTLDSWGYSPLNQINRNNVGRLRMAWTRGMGPGNIQEAT